MHYSLEPNQSDIAPFKPHLAPARPMPRTSHLSTVPTSRPFHLCRRSSMPSFPPFVKAEEHWDLNSTLPSDYQSTLSGAFGSGLQPPRQQGADVYHGSQTSEATSASPHDDWYELFDMTQASNTPVKLARSNEMTLVFRSPACWSNAAATVFAQ